MLVYARSPCLLFRIGRPPLENWPKSRNRYTTWRNRRERDSPGYCDPLADYLEEWTAAAGPNNFPKDPPNATLSVYEGGKTENTLAVVEISDPKVEGNDLVYHYKLIEGPMPESGGAAALFIDWIGPGGGVGVGFHGVGAGTRGVGLFGGYGGPRR